MMINTYRLEITVIAMAFIKPITANTTAALSIFLTVSFLKRLNIAITSRFICLHYIMNFTLFASVLFIIFFVIDALDKL